MKAWIAEVAGVFRAASAFVWRATRTRLAEGARRLGFVRADLLVVSRLTYPEISPPGQLILVEDAGIQKWACLECPGGCGKMISLSLNQARRPRWSVHADFWRRPSVEPSVHQKDECGCHFWIRRGQIDWCKGGRPRQVS